MQDTSPEALLAIAAALSREVGDDTLPITSALVDAISALNAVAAEKGGYSEAPKSRQVPLPFIDRVLP